MKTRSVLLLAAGAYLFLQACSKNEYVTKSITATDPISSSSGLMLYNVGDAGVYQVLSNTGGSVEIANNSTKVGGTGDVSVYSGTSFQKWKITRVSTEYCTIMNVGSGLYAQSYNYKGAEVLIQNTVNNTDAQLWSVVPIGPKTYKAINKADGLAITGNGTAMIKLKTFTNLPEQIWGYSILPGSDTLKSKTFSVSNVLQSNMVIQRDKPFQVWGQATPNFKVSVKASWNAGLFTAVADAKGNWKLAIPSASVNTSPQTLIASVNGFQPDTLKNILIGDVWVCGGQSNMQMPMVKSDDLFGGFNGVLNYQSEIAAANYPNIRLMLVDSNTTINGIGIDKANYQGSPQDYNPKISPWQVCSPATVARFSATAYYFGKKVYTSLAAKGQIVPIGLVVSCLGGTPCQQWTSKETIQSDPTLNAYYGTNGNSQLYNGMIYPLRNLSIKGFIWYQGESNESDNPQSNYTILNSKMIGNWRAIFNQGDLPFYFVQVAPLSYDFFSTTPWGADTTSNTSALLRDAQAKVRNVTQHTGMATTADMDEVITIHNQNKAPVGDRLGRLALANDYGQSVNPYGPAYQSFVQNDRQVVITFAHAAGLNTGGAALKQYFTVAGDNNVFKYARATISGETIVLNIPADITTVKNIRYAFFDWPVTNIANSDGLPMEPFRTDSFLK